MMAITCTSCYTRYVPPPLPQNKYEKSCPNCRDKEQHLAIDTDLLADLKDEEPWEPSE